MFTLLCWPAHNLSWWLFVFVFRCALHATLQPRHPTSPTPSPCSPSCGRPNAAVEAAEPALLARRLWRALLLPTPPHRASALSGHPRPPTTSPPGCPRPLPPATTRSITTTITCTSRLRGRPSPSPPTASRRLSFQPCTARDEGEDGFNGVQRGGNTHWDFEWPRGERHGTLSFCFLKMNSLLLEISFCSFIYCRFNFCPNPGKNHYGVQKKLWKL